MSDKIEKILNYCNGCMKFKAANRSCRAFKEPFPLWGKPGETCWAREENPLKYKQEIMDMKAYGMDNGEAMHNLNKEVKRVNEILDRDIEQCWYEQEHIKVQGSGGEKADGNPFGPQAMKDNRFVHRRNNPKREDWNDKYGK